MSTQLKLISSQAPWQFESLGVQNNDGSYVESDLFPIGQVVELTNGNFPMYDYRDYIAGQTHTFDGKVVKVTRFDVCLKPEVPPPITPIEPTLPDLTGPPPPDPDAPVTDPDAPVTDPDATIEPSPVIEEYVPPLREYASCVLYVSLVE